MRAKRAAVGARVPGVVGAFVQHFQLRGAQLFTQAQRQVVSGDIHTVLSVSAASGAGSSEPR